MKTPILLLLAGLAATAASAQTTCRFGVRGGGNYATITEKEAPQRVIPNFSGSYDKLPIFAGQLGVVLEFARGRFAFQPALLFSQKGTLIKGEGIAALDTVGYTVRREGRTTPRYNWLEMPLNLVYTLPGNSGLQVFAGPYAAVGIGGRAATVINTSSNDPNRPVESPLSKFVDKIEYGLPEASSGGGTFSIRGYASRRVDAGFNAGVGYRCLVRPRLYITHLMDDRNRTAPTPG